MLPACLHEEVVLHAPPHFLELGGGDQVLVRRHELIGPPANVVHVRERPADGGRRAIVVRVQRNVEVPARRQRSGVEEGGLLLLLLMLLLSCILRCVIGGEEEEEEEEGEGGSRGQREERHM